MLNISFIKRSFSWLFLQLPPMLKYWCILADGVMEAEKSHDLSYATWRPWKVVEVKGMKAKEGDRRCRFPLKTKSRVQGKTDVSAKQSGGEPANPSFLHLFLFVCFYSGLQYIGYCSSTYAKTIHSTQSSDSNANVFQKQAHRSNI